MNAWHQTSAYWLSQFREALCNKEFGDAELFYNRAQFMKRRGDLIEVLSEICDKAGFAEDSYGRK